MRAGDTETRKKIVRVLEENGPLTFGQIARLFGIRYKSVEQFLVTLDNSGEALLMEDDSGRVSLFEMQYE
jgi:predicted ArsR family transcriptional regulator